MRGAREKRRSFHLDTESKVFHHDHAGWGSCDALSKPNAVQSRGQIHQSREISPPPLKRKRTAFEEHNTGQDASRLIGLSAPDDSLHRERFSGPSQTLHSFQVSSIHHARKEQGRKVSSLQKAHCISKQLPKPGFSSKPVCRVCDKTTATSYNPIIACSGCARSYHDSCRKPPLIQGVEPQHWKCSACLNETEKPAKFALSSTSVPVRHSVVRDIFRLRSTRPPTVNSVRPSHKTATDEHVNTQTVRTGTQSAASLESLDRPKEVFESSPHPKHLDCRTIPSTPKHHSSQPGDIDCSSQGHHVDAKTGMLAVSTIPVQNPISTIILCPACQQQSISVRPGNKSPQCRSCRSKSRIEIRQLEIPETPDAAACHDVPDLMSSTEVAETMASKTVPRTVGTKSPSCLGPSRTSLKPNIRKVGDHTAPYTLTASCNDLESSISTRIVSVSNRTEQKTVLQAVQAHQTSTPEHASLQRPHKGQQCEQEHQKSFDMSKAIEDSGRTPPVLPVRYRREEAEAHPSQQQSHTPCVDDTTAHVPYSRHGESGTMALKSSSEATCSSLSPKIPIGSNVDDTDSPARQKRYTNRELARIALACANGASMTASQIIDWLVQKFPYLSEERSAWEKSFRPVLSLEEFRRNKAVGSHEARVVYSFANAAYKARYEEDYRDHIVDHSHGCRQRHVTRPAAATDPRGNVGEIVKSIQKQHSRGGLQKAIKSAPTGYTQSTWRNTSKSTASSRHSAAVPATPDPSFIPSPVSTTSNDNPPLNLLKLSSLTSLRDLAHYASGIKRETSFHCVYPHDTHPSIEMMTAEEKARKVAEIRARPSRKDLFDSNQRLAHVRRYRRQDIHDESDGAWKPQSAGAKENLIEEDTIAKNCNEPRSLREVFNLPANAVPMNDGNEMAFRDGTMVNGRLPRPRHIYRVGKRLGAGLTVN